MIQATSNAEHVEFTDNPNSWWPEDSPHRDVRLRHASVRQGPHSGFGSLTYVSREVSYLSPSFSCYFHLFLDLHWSRDADCSRGSDAYFHFRAFIPGGSETAKLHCIQMQQIDHDDGEKTFKAIFFQNDPLEWFDEWWLTGYGMNLRVWDRKLGYRKRACCDWIWVSDVGE